MVYGGTSAGVISAVQAKKMGKSVAIVGPDKHLGGLTSGGLGWTDTGNNEKPRTVEDCLEAHPYLREVSVVQEVLEGKFKADEPEDEYGSEQETEDSPGKNLPEQAGTEAPEAIEELEVKEGSLTAVKVKSPEKPRESSLGAKVGGKSPERVVTGAEIRISPAKEHAESAIERNGDLPLVKMSDPIPMGKGKLNIILAQTEEQARRYERPQPEGLELQAGTYSPISNEPWPPVRSSPVKGEGNLDGRKDSPVYRKSYSSTGDEDDNEEEDSSSTSDRSGSTSPEQNPGSQAVMVSEVAAHDFLIPVAALHEGRDPLGLQDLLRNTVEKEVGVSQEVPALSEGPFEITPLTGKTAASPNQHDIQEHDETCVGSTVACEPTKEPTEVAEEGPGEVSMFWGSYGQPTFRIKVMPAKDKDNKVPNQEEVEHKSIEAESEVSAQEGTGAPEEATGQDSRASSRGTSQHSPVAGGSTAPDWLEPGIDDAVAYCSAGEEEAAGNKRKRGKPAQDSPSGKSPKKTRQTGKGKSTPVTNF